MHYQDGSHRWVPPDPDMDQDAWEAALRAHLHHHREIFGGASGRNDQGRGRAKPRSARSAGRDAARQPDDPTRQGNGRRS
ncbi:hypothetical protein AB0J86_29440 [Micromonospora sp. NPDC049559]|uniref:hypothetical protein n=1 Tax=Micromonospora sp. NPDC049559 TaxID=3155923 RepID=UPI0034365DC7